MGQGMGVTCIIYNDILCSMVAMGIRTWRIGRDSS